jgi:hypothetical protein
MLDLTQDDLYDLSELAREKSLEAGDDEPDLRDRMMALAVRLAAAGDEAE